MRVLLVTPYFAPAFVYGGPPRSIFGLSLALVRAGVQVEVFTTTANGPAELPASGPGGDVHEGVPVRYFPRRPPWRLFRAAGMESALRASFGRFDLVHVHTLWNLTSWTAIRAARRAGIPYVVSPRGMLNAAALRVRAWPKWLLYHLVERRNLAGAAALHATSPEEADTLRARGLGVEVFVLPNGVDLEAAPPERGEMRRRLGLGPETFLVGFLGRIHAIKRLDLLADAFLRLRARRPPAYLVLAGHPEQESYRQMLQRRLKPAAADVRWAGQLDGEDKRRLLADADALVVCSDQESFGMSVVEGMAAGVPVVVTRTCPWQEIETAGCGFWVEQNAEAIAAALERLAADRNLGREMGDRGRRLVQGRYTWDAIAKSMAAHYAAAAGKVARRVALPSPLAADPTPVRAE